MTRENMFQAKEREAWVTPDIEQDLLKTAQDGSLTCAQAMQFAHSHTIPMKKMKYLTDLLKIKLTSCQLGCF